VLQLAAIQLITVTRFTVEPLPAITTTIADIVIAARPPALKLLAITRAAIAPQAIPNGRPKRPTSDCPVVRAAAYFPRVGVVRGSFSPTSRFSMTKSSSCFLISWTFCVFQPPSSVRPALSAGGDRLALGLCEWLARCERRTLAGQG